ncbi:MAG: MarC family protein [Gammaproteobacteria bacterium]|nr:MarC family protein [Gammaproteobacteria bacterium]
MLINYFLYAFIALFPIVNPIAMSSAFYSLTIQATDQQRKKLATLVALYGTTLLLSTLLIGPFILRFFGLQAADIRVAGGLVVFSIAWQMLNPPRKQVKPKEIYNDDVMNLAFFPLTMPLTAGAGSIAITIALATQAHKASNMFDQYISVALAIIAIFILVFFCYRYAGTIFKVLGKTGGKVVSSLSAFILLAIGVSIIWSGIQLFIASMTK